LASHDRLTRNKWAASVGVSKRWTLPLDLPAGWAFMAWLLLNKEPAN
jgi:hypothetical protein